MNDKITKFSLDIYQTLVNASLIEHTLPFGDQISPRHVKGFYRGFWQVYSYVKGSDTLSKINPDLIQNIDEWFRLIDGNLSDNELLLKGCDLYVDLVEENLQQGGMNNAAV